MIMHTVLSVRGKLLFSLKISLYFDEKYFDFLMQNSIMLFHLNFMLIKLCLKENNWKFLDNSSDFVCEKIEFMWHKIVRVYMRQRAFISQTIQYNILIFIYHIYTSIITPSSISSEEITKWAMHASINPPQNLDV